MFCVSTLLSPKESCKALLSDPLWTKRLQAVSLVEEQSLSWHVSYSPLSSVWPGGELVIFY